MRYSKLPRSKEEANQYSPRIPFYFDNSMCKHGHVSPRYSVNGMCVACAKSRNKGSKFDPEQVAFDFVERKMQELPETVKRVFIPEPQRKVADALEAFAQWKGWMRGPDI